MDLSLEGVSLEFIMHSKTWHQTMVTIIFYQFYLKDCPI